MMKAIVLLSALLAVTVALPRDEQLYERNEVISESQFDRFVDRNLKVVVPITWFFWKKSW